MDNSKGTVPKTSLKEQMEEITARLEQGVKEIYASGQYADYLRIMSRFHNYSFRNSVLIYMQKPDATRVAGFTTWKNTFGRNVKKGEKGIRILAPAPYKSVIEETHDQNGSLYLGADGNPAARRKEVTIPAFKPVSVFDVSQTEGRELPSLGIPTLEGEVKDYASFLEALKNASPVPVAFEQMKSDTDGYYSLTDKRIALREGMSEVQTAVAAVHEITHATLHDPDQRDGDDKKRKDRRTQEIEAESVAYTVCQHYGVESAANSFAYVADWSSDKELSELQASLETIQKTSAALIGSIDTQLALLQAKVAEQEQPLSSVDFAHNLIDEYEMFGTPQWHSVFGDCEKDLLVNYAVHQSNFDDISLLAAKLAEEKHELTHGQIDYDVKNRVDLFCKKIDRLQEPAAIYLDAPFTPVIEILTKTEGDSSAVGQYYILDGDARYTVDETDTDFFPVKTVDLDSGERVTVGFSELREYTFEANAYRQHLFENNAISPSVKNLHFDGRAGTWEIIDRVGYKDDTYYAALKMGAGAEAPQYLLADQTGNVVYTPALSADVTPDHSDFVHWVNHAVAETHIERVNRKSEKTSITDRLAGAKESLESQTPKQPQHEKRAEMER